MGRYKSLGSLISFLWYAHQPSGANILCFRILSLFKAQHWEKLQSDAYLLLFNHSVMSNSFRSHGLQNTRLPCPSPSPGVCSNSGQWCYPTISSSVVSFFCLLSFPASGFFFSPPVNQLFTSGGQSIGASASASVLPMNIQGWFSLGSTGLISLQSKRPSRVFSNTTVQKHQFFGA